MKNNRSKSDRARNVQSQQTARAYIRQDLWDAALNWNQRFVWDAGQGIARPAEPKDIFPTFPAISREAMTASRAEFFADSLGDLQGHDLTLATRWRDGRLKTSELPKFVHQRWNKVLTHIVRRHIDNFFASQIQVETDALTSSEKSVDDSKAEPTPDTSIILDENISSARDAGNFFVVGELLLRRLVASRLDPEGQIFAQTVVAWASSKGPLFQPKTIEELIEQVGSIPEPNLSVSLINVLYSLRKHSLDPHVNFGDIAFKLRDSISEIYDLDDRRSPLDSCNAAVAALEMRLTELEGAANRFVRTTLSNARNASIDIIRISRSLYEILIPTECEFLRDLEMVFGPFFRKLCESYARNEDIEVIRRAPELLENVKGCFLNSKDSQPYSFTWNSVVRPILTHLSTLLEEAQTRGEVALAPVLRLRTSTTKSHLTEPGRNIYLSFSLRNSGRGHAFYVSMKNTPHDGVANFTLVEPPGPFDVAPGAEQLVRVCLTLTAPTKEATIDVGWLCQTARGNDASFQDRIVIKQQETEPNWDSLIADPPYSLNPIRNRERLFGRDAVLRTLTLAAMSGASTFVWGQKRIGKTSLLQVFASQLAVNSNTICLTLRMGEIGALHEGEIGQLIARRIVEKSGLAVAVPSESEFGAGIGRLVSFAELLSEKAPSHKFIVIVDEFDDIDSRFYIGERGRQFVKALRSISEAGITFFFVGSERMEAIYHAHQADLNKWSNVYLDRITSRNECKSLIENPVKQAIEFSQEAIDFIIDYTDGNPFYINNFCFHVFDRCLQEHRTFIDGSDTNAVRQHLLRALGESNFSQFWQDNPILDARERQQAEGEICIALACISALGGRYEAVADLLGAQEGLPLATNDYATENELRHACERLMSRNIIKKRDREDQFVIVLQIFGEWLRENAISKLLPNWTQFQAARRLEAIKPEIIVSQEKVSDASGFIIAEDELLAVSQKLVYCGRQKDVAEIRCWLRQFDDESRIEIAFQLLKRLAEKGFINEGARSLAYSKIEEIIKARRLEVGDKVWKIERGRLDNLCLAYVDSGTKSGIATARELRNILRPGKSGSADEMGTWMERHLDEDPMLVIVDDFAGTGSSLVKGLLRCQDRIDKDLWRRYISEGRISLFVMYSFPEALENIRTQIPGIHVVGSTVLGDELRACAEEAGIFEEEGDRRFARDVALQLGRDLYPDAPLGFGGIGGLVAFHNTIPNNTLPIFWSNGRVSGRAWIPIFPRP